MEGLGISGIINRIRLDFMYRGVSLEGYVLDGLSTMVGCMLSERTPNLMVLAEALPRDIALAENRYQYIRRHLRRDELCVDKVIRTYAILDNEVVRTRGLFNILAIYESSSACLS